MERRLGYLSSYFPKEIAHAFGFIPVRLMPKVRTATSAEGVLPRNFCAYLKLITASLLDSSYSLEGVIVLHEDDSHRRLYDVWRALAVTPFLAFVDLPARNDEQARRRFLSQLGKLVSMLEDREGPLAPKALASSIELYNRLRKLWRKARRFWLEGRLATLDYYDLRITALTADPSYAIGAFQHALSSVKSQPVPAGPRILLIGGQVVKRELVSLIEEAGGRVAGEDSDADERELLDEIPVNGDIQVMLANLARAYLGKPPSPRSRNPQARLAYLRALIDERGIEGVVFSHYKFCDLHLAEYPLLAAWFRERSIPSLLLEEEEEELSGQALTRIEAFLEMLR